MLVILFRLVAHTFRWLLNTVRTPTPAIRSLLYLQMPEIFDLRVSGKGNLK
jgi:hypothetical protein